MADGSVHSQRLCVFTRSPELERVKTRLARQIGAVAALDAHIQLVSRTLDRVVARSESGTVVQRSMDWEAELWISGSPDSPCVRRWVSEFSLRLHQQQGADLGQRMRHALFPATTSRGGVLIGTDCPDIDADYVRAAFDALKEVDVVLGPAEDGGYGLIGMYRDSPALFESIPWSTADVRSSTLAQAERAGLRVACLPMIWDVDTEADWLRFRRGSGSQPGTADRVRD